MLSQKDSWSDVDSEAITQPRMQTATAMLLRAIEKS